MRIFKIFQIKNFKHKFLKVWSFINLPWGLVRSHTKLWPNRFSSFDVYWTQTDTRTDKVNEGLLLNNRSLRKLTRWRFTPILNLNFKLFLFVYIAKQKQKKVRGFLKKISWIFKIYWKSNFVWGKFLKFWSFINLPCRVQGSWDVRYHK